MPRDGSNIEKWYKELLKKMKEPTGARGWQPDEPAQDWVNNAIEKIFGKGTATPAYVMGNRGVTLPPETGGYQTNPLGNALVASPWLSSMQPGAAGSWEPTAPVTAAPTAPVTAAPTHQPMVYEPQPVGSWEEQKAIPKDVGWQPTNYQGIRDWIGEANKGDFQPGWYGYDPNTPGTFTYGGSYEQMQNLGLDKGAYYSPNYGTGGGKNAPGGPSHWRGPQSASGLAKALSPEEMQAEIDKLTKQKQNYQFKKERLQGGGYAGGSGSQLRYKKLQKRLGVLKAELDKTGWQPGYGTENAASGTGVGWSW